MEKLFSAALFCLLLLPTPVSSQTSEFGVSAGLITHVSEGPGAFDRARRTTSLHAGVWWLDRLETAFRIGWMARPNGYATYAYGCGPFVAGAPRCVPLGTFRVIKVANPRMFLTGDVVYHFRRGESVRPFAGVALGVIRDGDRWTCELEGCAALLPRLRLGRTTTSYPDLGVQAGVSTVVAKHLVVRAGVRIHDLRLIEGVSGLELSAGLGYRW